MAQLQFISTATIMKITTFRKDGKYSDGRHPDTVEFTSDLIYDLERRDFTINAMAYNVEEGLIDPFNGYQDIQDKIIRCVGNPNDRFREDGLRILRCLRFATQLGFRVDLLTRSALVKQINFLDNISSERINSELCKIIDASALYKSKRLLYTYAFILCHCVPELYDGLNFPQKNPYHKYSVYGHTIVVLQECESSDLITKLTAFFHDIGKPHCYQDDENGIRHFKGAR